MEDARAKLTESLSRRCEVYGDRYVPQPTGFVDEAGEADPLVLEVLPGGPRSPVVDAKRASATAADRQKQERAAELRRLVTMGPLVLGNRDAVAGVDPELLAEARRIVGEQNELAREHVSWST